MLPWAEGAQGPWAGETVVQLPLAPLPCPGQALPTASSTACVPATVPRGGRDDPPPELSVQMAARSWWSQRPPRARSPGFWGHWPWCPLPGRPAERPARPAALGAPAAGSPNPRLSPAPAWDRPLTPEPRRPPPGASAGPMFLFGAAPSTSFRHPETPRGVPGGLPGLAEPPCLTPRCVGARPSPWGPQRVALPGPRLAARGRTHLRLSVQKG